jgi:lantibiotic modifying enzyme
MDILSGLAGCAIVLVNLYHLTGEAKCYELALRCGNRLCENAKPFGQGVGWFLPNISSEPLAGFAHGVAGIAWALLIIAEMSGDERYRQIALSSINYERGLFVLDQGNWLDLRNLVTTSPFHNHIPTRWCHGAPGVLLGRSLILPYLDDGLVLSEITTGIDTTLANGFGGSHCLCHGDLGNADILFTVGERLGRADLCEHAHRIAGSVLQSGLNGNGWKCGLPQSATTPSFMVGLAGIGYGLLRFWSPAQVPSVLQLALPILPHKTLASHKTYNG